MSPENENTAERRTRDLYETPKNVEPKFTVVVVCLFVSVTQPSDSKATTQRRL